MVVELLGIVKGLMLRVEGEGKHQMLYKDPHGLSGWVEEYCGIILIRGGQCSWIRCQNFAGLYGLHFVGNYFFA